MPNTNFSSSCIISFHPYSDSINRLHSGDEEESRPEVHYFPNQLRFTYLLIPKLKILSRAGAG